MFQYGSRFNLQGLGHPAPSTMDDSRDGQPSKWEAREMEKYGLMPNIQRTASPMS